MVAGSKKYRNLYGSQKRTFGTTDTERTKLEAEYNQLKLEALKNRQFAHNNNNNNFANLDQFFTNKFILIGGCVLIGLGLGYLLFSNRQKNRGRC